ncbi:hypothetical protein ACHAW5_003272 [Stephanodiscus triporus]|uniref:Uncharacterized protein n=1 Tax=Stephanodiscus triporus TaxID=2934178 RepID=A0ABD3NQB9_9STRA
MADGDDNGC